MGIDIKAGGRLKVHKRTNPKSDNPYLRLIHKLYKFLSRRTDSKFNKVIRDRLVHTRVRKHPLSLSKLTAHMKGKDEKIAVIVAPITDDVRLLEVPKLSVCALRFTETARARILKAGGECLTFDQLALRAPMGRGCILLRGPIKHRKQEKYFGKAPGVPNSTTRPYVRKATNLKRKSRKFEMARGRRRSRCYRV
eukprot:GEMP01028322.1.p1 GENE.GEMP01028322.1~~GEMP01028322.1.p1  ORF type:complete len:205 (+),score=42.65 GEMP01028322.1:36-617(+)